MSDVLCPYCDSADTIFKKKAQQWECENCEQRFENVEDNSVPKRIFLSYPHRPDEHSQLVEDVARVIKEKGHDPWFDKNKITPGYDWRMSITKGVLDSDWMIIFMSEEALRPGGVCLDEVGIALHQKEGDETLLTVLLEEEAKVNPPISLTRVQWLDAKNFADYYPKDRNDAEAVKKWDDWLDEEVTKLIRHIEKKGDITGQISKLRGRLQPSSFVAEIAHSSQGFVGREWVFEQIETWKEHNRERRTFILQGPAGMGKSALAAQLSQQMRDVIGIHFCKHNDTSTKDAGNLVRTMAFQIASRNPEYRHWLLDKKLQEEQFKGEKLHTKPAPELFRELIANAPEIDSKSKSRQLLVIDGLDEAFDEQGKNKILELIRDEFKKLPQWLGVVVTTRPEQEIVSDLSTPHTLSVSDQRNHRDIREYLEQQFKSMIVFADKPEALRKAISLGVERSDGIMLYANQLIRGIVEGRVNPLESAQFPKGLADIYKGFLDRAFERVADYRETSARVLELLSVCTLPLPEHFICEYLDITTSEFADFIRPLSSLLVTERGNGDKAYVLFHKSFADWLVAPEEIHRYRLIGDSKKHIARYIYEKSNSEVSGRSITPYLLWEIDVLLLDCITYLPIWNDMYGLNNFAKWLHQMRATNAELQVTKRQLDLEFLTYEEGSLKTLTSKSDLATAYTQMGNYEAAWGIYEELIKQLGDLLDLNFYSLTSDYDDMDSQEEVDFGEYIFDNLIKVCELLFEVSKNADPFLSKVTALLIVNLANYQLRLGESGLAISISRRIIELSSFNSCLDKELIRSSTSNLADSLYHEMKFEEAKTFFQSLVEMNISDFGLEDLRTIDAIQGLACVKYHLGEYNEAMTRQDYVLEYYANRYGWRHLDTIMLLEQKSFTLLALKNFQESMDCLQRAFKLLSADLRADPKFVLENKSRRLDILIQQEKYTEAQSLSYEIIEDIDSFNLRNTIECEALVSVCELVEKLYQRRLFDNANKLNLELHKHSMAILRLEFFKFLQNEALFYLANNYLDKAKVFFNHIHHFSVLNYGYGHDATIESMIGLAAICRIKGEFQSARDYLEKVISIQKQKLIYSNIDILITKSYLSELLLLDCKKKEAVRLQLEICRLTIGDTHPITISNEHYLRTLEISQDEEL